MRLEAAGPSTQARRRRTLALAALSAAIHLAVLAPLALTTSRLDLRESPETTAILIPVELGRAGAWAARPVGVRVREPARLAGGRRGADASPARTRATLPAAGSPAPAGPPDAVVGDPSIGDPWRVRRGLGPPARLPCPAAHDNPLGQKLCAVGPTPDHDPPLLTRADLLPNHDPAPGRRREAGFERQTEANEAWRSYTREGGAYPGLRSLFSER